MTDREQGLSKAQQDNLDIGLETAKRVLMKSQLVTIFEAIKSAGLDPSEFRWERKGSGWNTSTPCAFLIYYDTNFHFRFDRNSSLDQWKAERSPGLNTLIERPDARDWPHILIFFREWLVYLKREIESPDVWGALSQEKEIISAASQPSGENSEFTVAEKEYVLSGLAEIQRYLIEAHKLDPELVESRINYLTGAVERLGRFDWKNLLLSTIIGIILNSTVSPEAARDIMRFVASTLHQILQAHGLLSA